MGDHGKAMEQKMTPVFKRLLIAGLFSTPLAFLLKGIGNSYWDSTLIVGLGSFVLIAVFKALIKGTINWYINGFSVAIVLLTALFKLLHFKEAEWLMYGALAAIMISVLNLFRNIFIPVREKVEE